MFHDISNNESNRLNSRSLSLSFCNFHAKLHSLKSGQVCLKYFGAIIYASNIVNLPRHSTHADRFPRNRGKGRRRLSLRLDISTTLSVDNKHYTSV